MNDAERLSHVVTNRDALNSHVRELRQHDVPVKLDSWPDNELQTALKDGLGALPEERLEWLDLNPIALFRLHDAINESLPDHWMELVIEDAERGRNEAPSAQEIRMTERHIKIGIQALTELVEQTLTCRSAQSMDFVVEVIGEGQDSIVIRGRPTDEIDVEDVECIKARVYWMGDVMQTRPAGLCTLGPMIRVCHIRESGDEIDSVYLSAEPNVLWAYIYAGN